MPQRDVTAVWVSAHAATAPPIAGPALLTGVAVVVVNRLFRLLALWLRLRAQANEDAARFRYAAHALARSPAVNLEIVNRDGTALRISGEPPAAEGIDHG
jgi:hypothetical protein